LDFLIFLDCVTQYTKSDIDKGKTPLDVYTLCAIIRESFCISYTIRKNNNLYLYFETDNLFIKIEGKSVRYLGSDERSQALLLLRAIMKIETNENYDHREWIKSTPGIYIKKLPSSEFILENINGNFNDNRIFITDISKEKVKQNVKYGENIDENSSDCYLFSFSQDSIPFLKFIQKVNEECSLKNIDLSKIRGIENKILYINFLDDHRNY
jgi:tRNA pseudouridine-54 N-methylase